MYNLGNITIVLPSYKCNKRCPFCIAKNNQKFKNEEKENLEKLSKTLKELRDNNIRFNRLVLSGNGEPSLYSLETLKKYAEIIKENADLFEGLRIHSSGNIFFEEEKFELFNNLLPNVEFDVLRTSIDPENDMKVLGYEKDYTQTEAFKKAKNIKLDIALTKNLELENFPEKLDEFIKNHPNVSKIRFKKLMSGDNKESNEAKWVEENTITKNEFEKLGEDILNYYQCKTFDELKTKSEQKIVFEKTGNYEQDIVYSKGTCMDYAENPIKIEDMIEMSKNIDSNKSIIYNDNNEIER